MHKPVTGDTFFRQYCRNFVNFAESWLVKSILRPFFFIMPPSLLTFLATRSGMQEEVQQLFGTEIAAYLNESAILILFFAFLYVTIVKAIYSGILLYSKPEREIGRDDLHVILKTLNIVVGDKMKRFAKRVKLVVDQRNLNGGNIFQEITQPTQQIGLLVSALRGAFESIDQTNALFRVGLLTVKNGKPEEWAHFDPAERPPRTTPEQLSCVGSTVMRCIKAKSSVLVEDIAKEITVKSKKNRRYLKCNTKDGENGSQLCYPIIHPTTGKIVYVITIAGNKKCCLPEKHLPLFEWIIEHYALRINLEHSLFILKENINAA